MKTQIENIIAASMQDREHNPSVQARHSGKSTAWQDVTPEQLNEIAQVISENEQILVAKLIQCMKEQDVYDTGVVGEMYDHTFDLEFEADTLAELQRRVGHFFDIETEVFVNEAGEVEIAFSQYECNNGSPAIQSDMNRWKKGKQRLWIVNYKFKVFILRTLKMNV